MAMPSARPPIVVIRTDLRPPIRPRRATKTSSAVSPTGVIGPWIGPDDDGGEPAMTEAMTQLVAASRCGE